MVQLFLSTESGRRTTGNPFSYCLPEHKKTGAYGTGNHGINMCYLLKLSLFLTMTSCAPPSTIDVALTSVSLAFFCSSGIVSAPQLHMVERIFAVVSAAVSCLYLLTENVLVVIFAALAIAAVSMSIDYCIRDPLDEPKYNIEYYDIHSGKMVKYYDVNEDGKVIKEENPDYIGGTERALLSAVKCISPYSQLKELSESERNPFYVLSDAGLIVLITSGGYLIWRKKDLF